MSKNKDQKRNAQLATRAKNESFRFQVEYTRKQKSIDIMGMERNLTAELDAICQNGLTEALFDLAKIVEGIRKELGDFIASSRIDVWIYGHSHTNIDASIGKTRIVSNQLGYVFNDEHLSNGFDAGKIITLD